MRIKKIVSQYRRDFVAVYECQHCGDTVEGSGYDDDHFQRNVVPEMECRKCGKKASSDFRPRGTKYAEGEIV